MSSTAASSYTYWELTVKTTERPSPPLLRLCRHLYVFLGPAALPSPEMVPKTTLAVVKPTAAPPPPKKSRRNESEEVRVQFGIRANPTVRQPKATTPGIFQLHAICDSFAWPREPFPSPYTLLLLGGY